MIAPGQPNIQSAGHHTPTNQHRATHERASQRAGRTDDTQNSGSFCHACTLRLTTPSQKDIGYLSTCDPELILDHSKPLRVSAWMAVPSPSQAAIYRKLCEVVGCGVQPSYGLSGEKAYPHPRAFTSETFEGGNASHEFLSFRRVDTQAVYA